MDLRQHFLLGPLSCDILGSMLLDSCPRGPFPVRMLQLWSLLEALVLKMDWMFQIEQMSGGLDVCLDSGGILGRVCVCTGGAGGILTAGSGGIWKRVRFHGVVYLNSKVQVV